MVDYLQVLKGLKKKKKNKINVVFLSNFNNIILNNYINYFFKTNTIYEVKFLKTQFDQIHQQLFNKEILSTIKKNEFIILGLDANINLFFNEKKTNFFLKNLRSYCDLLINEFHNKKILIFNLSYTESFNLLSKNKKSIFKKKIYGFNNYLENLENKYLNIDVIDIYNIFSKLGLENSINKIDINLFKIPYTEKSNELISKEIFKKINSSFEIRKKCLVVDLDNTLWGGILGEVGYNNIDLGKTLLGEAFKKFQLYLKLLSNDGVILAISSKNNFEDVKECFNKNNEMVLSLKDFSSIKINWDEKYLNVNKIANELNISKDSIVFFDDSKIEQDKMKKFNPDVNTICVSKHPKDFINDINNSGYFNYNIITKEDKNKKYQYNILNKAKELKNKSNDIISFYKNLNMKLEIEKVSNKTFERAVQLINKTNQFNLTTIRYDTNGFKKYLKQKYNNAYIAKLTDVYGDHGFTALVIISSIKDYWNIENFLLSCRILGRRVEEEFLQQIILIAKKNKISTIKGLYIKSKKNHQCKDFYIKNKFTKKGDYFYIKTKSFKYVNKYIKSKYIKL